LSFFDSIIHILLAQGAFLCKILDKGTIRCITFVSPGRLFWAWFWERLYKTISCYYWSYWSDYRCPVGGSEILRQRKEAR